MGRDNVVRRNFTCAIMWASISAALRRAALRPDALNRSTNFCMVGGAASCFSQTPVVLGAAGTAWP